LPDGFFSDQKSQFGYILEDLGMENAVIHIGILVIWIILPPLGIFYGKLVILRSFGKFFPLWCIVPRQIWQPWTPRP
jgi:hypothetical protein